MAEKVFCLLESIIFKRLSPPYNQEAKMFYFLASMETERMEPNTVLVSRLWNVKERSAAT